MAKQSNPVVIPEELIEDVELVVAAAEPEEETPSMVDSLEKQPLLAPEAGEEIMNKKMDAVKKAEQLGPATKNILRAFESDERFV